MIHIKTPATTANMGPGFDCIGMAFELYNQIWVEETEKDLVIELKNNQIDVPTNEENLIYSSILQFYEETGITRKFQGLKIIQEDYIPFTRGLGSSAACIVSGLLAANELSGANLSQKTIAEIAAKIETHPDNSTPAILGGIIVGAMCGEKLEYIKIDTSSLVSSGLKFAVMIPEFPLSTTKARNVLPDMYSRKDVVFNTSRSALLVACLLNKQYDKLMIAMDDCIHQPYRKSIIPGMDEIFERSKYFGAKSVFLSGAGPTIIALYTEDVVAEKLEEFLPTLPDKWNLHKLVPDNVGAVVRHI